MDATLFKRVFASLLGALMIAFGAVGAHAQSTDQGAAQARVVQGLNITKVDDLAFGQIVAGDAGGTVTINSATGNATQLGGARMLPSTRHRGKFTSNAQLGVLFIINGDPAVTLVRNGGGGSMTATLNYSPASGIGLVGLITVNLVAISPTQEIDVGGTLTVAGNQPPGDYSGTFDVTITYL